MRPPRRPMCAPFHALRSVRKHAHQEQARMSGGAGFSLLKLWEARWVRLEEAERAAEATEGAGAIVHDTFFHSRGESEAKALLLFKRLEIVPLSFPHLIEQGADLGR